ncbi:DUF6600 domain-containing protein [Undibacterium sp.]|uniref:DUF6600 domain-containing protein n=1 Tax=Undibacterium sp. TaxID=1914977 RepID=UPI0025D74C65|nr:DUF6600 domain-containing protein [Undibacterium sp.]
MPAFQQYTSRLLCAMLLVCNFLASGWAQAQEDPPSRVARLSYTLGSVSLAPAGSEQWLVADPNRPLTSGDRLWVPAGARAELHLGASSLRLAENTGITIVKLSDHQLQLKLNTGTLVIRQRSLGSQEVIELNTPNLAFALQEAGEYKLTVSPNQSSIMVRRGTGIAYGERDSITLHEAEQVNFSGNNLAHNSIARMPPYDEFDLWVNERDKLEDNSVSARYVSREVIGYQQLDQHGSWETHVEYGAIWIPRTVEVGWAPYRNGNWVWVAPWGWTWVDRAPWGFAPFHYGRWACIGPRWVWVPGPYLHHASPVYAPALVAFVGAAPGVHLNININTGSHPHPAWLPLAPGEVYRPYYRGSSAYIERLNQHQDYRASINQNNNQNNTPLGDNQANRPYRNQALANAISSMPENQFLRGQASSVNPALLGATLVNNRAASTQSTALPPSSESIYGNAKRIAAPANDAWMRRAVIPSPERASSYRSAIQERNAEQIAEHDKPRYAPHYGNRIATPATSYNDNLAPPNELRNRPSPSMTAPAAIQPERARSNAVDYRNPIQNPANTASYAAPPNLPAKPSPTSNYAGWSQNNPAQAILQENERARDAERKQAERRAEQQTERRNQNEREAYGVRNQPSGNYQVEQNQRRSEAPRTMTESNHNARATIAPQETVRVNPTPEVRPVTQARPDRASIAEPKENPRNNHRTGQARELER